MQLFVARVGMLASLLLLGVSAFMNWRFGLSLGRNELDQWIFGATSIGADALKAAAPFYIWAAWRARRWVVTGATMLLWSVCSIYAVVSALGFAAVSRAEVAGMTVGKQDTLAGLRTDLTRKETQRSQLGTQEPVRVLAVRLDAQRQNWRWSASKDCRDITLKETRTFCDGINLLIEQHVKSAAAEKLDAEIAGLRERISPLAAVAGQDRGDAQAGLLSQLSGVSFGHIQMALTLLAVALVELGSGLGLFVASRFAELIARTPEALPTPSTEPAIAIVLPTGDVAQFVLQKLEERPNTKIELATLHSAYGAWCATKNHAPLSIEAFVSAFRCLADEVGYDVEDYDGTTVCGGLILMEPVPLDAAA
ncbi:MAG: hypothetical protein ABL907_20320 [Hyphomicrobium sp.]